MLVILATHQLNLASHIWSGNNNRSRTFSNRHSVVRYDEYIRFMTQKLPFWSALSWMADHFPKLFV